MKAILNCFLVMLISMVVFMDKYPQFQIYESKCGGSEHREGKKLLPYGSQFNLYSAASFSLLALTISLEEGPQSVDLGIFHFLLELTMDASIEMIENKLSNLWYILGVVIYCMVFIFASLLGPYKHSR